MLWSMKLMKHTAAVVALVLLAGCATTFRPWKLSEVEEGMDRAQVVHILGEPDFVETKDGAELLHYSYREDYNPPLTIDAHAPDAANRGLQNQQIQQGLKQYKYAVKLVDGKVQDYKELAD
jgi:hypothetical protein